jgi:hypothetical protein
MVYDHVLRYLFAGDVVGPATAFGRLAFPLFAFTFAYGLARPTTDTVRDIRILRRLAFFGLLAQPATAYFWGVYPLNILFTFFLSVLIILLLRHPERGWTVIVAGALFLVGGAIVEYAWIGLLLIIAVYFWSKTGTHILSLGALVLAYTGLNMMNGSLWALLSIPLILVASLWSLPLPRTKLFFYVFYPAHLLLIMGIHFIVHGGPPQHLF